MKYSSLKLASIVLLLLNCAAAPAFAGNAGKYYVAFDLGKTSYTNVTVPAAGGYPESTFPNPAMLRLAGGYHFNDSMAMEIGYSKFGDTALDYAGIGKVTLATSSFHAAAVGTLPLSSQIELIGKLGLSSNKAKLTGTGGFSGLSTESSKMDMLIGFGAQFNIDSVTTIRAQYESFGAMENSSTNPITASAFSVGFAHNY